MKISLSSPDITQKEIDLVTEVLRSPILSMGPWLQKFEQAIADYIGVKYAIGVNSGTSGLHLIVRSLELGEGDEVITTPFSFVASSNCILFERAKPVFVDINPRTLNLDLDQVQDAITPRTKAILPVHVFGQMLDMQRVRELANHYGLKVIEDSCEAIGGEFNSVKAGTLGDAAVFAFYPNKQITTGEGGVIVTNDERIAYLCRSMRNQGRGESGAWLAHERLGYNYRLNELSAALGAAQMDRLEDILTCRARVAQYYNEKLSQYDWVEVPYIDPRVRISWFVYVIRLTSGVNRDQVIKYLQAAGIDCRPYFTPIHLQPFYVKEFGYQVGDFPITEDVSNRTIALPFYNHLGEDEIDYVIEQLAAAIGK